MLPEDTILGHQDCIRVSLKVSIFHKGYVGKYTDWMNKRLEIKYPMFFRAQLCIMHKCASKKNECARNFFSKKKMVTPKTRTEMYAVVHLD